MGKFATVASTLAQRYAPPAPPVSVDPKHRTGRKLDAERFKHVTQRLSQIYGCEAPAMPVGASTTGDSGDMGASNGAGADAGADPGQGPHEAKGGGAAVDLDKAPHPAAQATVQAMAAVQDQAVADIAQQPLNPLPAYVVMNADGNFRVVEDTPQRKQASMVVTNALGKTHGLLVEEDRVVLSGGVNSTNLQLDDEGATFSDVGTGAAVVVSGVAAGRSTEDAANVGQLQAAVAPLGTRLDGVEDRVQQLDRKIKATEKKLSSGVAMALALNQPVSFAPQSRNAVTGGMATYNGQSALGFSFHRLVADTQTQRTTVSMGVGATTSGRGSACARVGACFSW